MTALSTREKLLAAARAEFAAHGIAGARVERIAKQAGVNKERLYGNFGSKEKLFEAVVSQALAEHTDAVGQPTGDLLEYVGKLFDFHRDNPQVLRLMLWEALHYGDGELPDEQTRAGHYADKVETLATTLGTEPGTRAAVTMLFLIGLAAWPSAVPQLTRTVLPGSADLTQVRAQVVDLARRMLRPE
ncbi:TetR family transcriptional regulator [Kibdelosporangium phytohabitans]|uniref:TetR family transcriptional regulator n=1 Tax=Kibdelosporangium phytohabitans TaxID=860235 RepID=A0A0N9IB47_9PSEU|nr:TetR family transcriptional regulator [Kibdelosporangium phytohabitans]ALG11849.1 TetR family transcriptional regulator [Kibdelosporangium phytohabitans]MBE1463275.1 AcrR family transcriptional regulator [Kibdelosporangium phytohabitans]